MLSMKRLWVRMQPFKPSMWRFSILLIPFTPLLALMQKRSSNVVFEILLLALVVTTPWQAFSWKHSVRVLYERPIRWLTLSWLLCVLWMAVSLTWALNPAFGAWVLFRWLIVLTTMIWLYRYRHAIADIYPPYIFSIALVLCLIVTLTLYSAFQRCTIPIRADHWNGSKLYALYINASIIIVFFFWVGWMECLALKWPVRIFFLAAIAYGIRHIDSDAAHLGLALGVITWGVCTYRPRWQKYFPVLVAGGLLLTPIVLKPLSHPTWGPRIVKLIPSHKARFIIWEHIAHDYIRTQPLKGHGLGTLTPGARVYIMPDFDTFPASRALQTLTPQDNPIDPHNGILHLWAELGVIGTVMFSIMAYLFLNHIRYHRPPSHVPFFFGFFTSFLLVLSVNCSLWHMWLWTSAGLAMLSLLLTSQKIHVQEDIKV